MESVACRGCDLLQRIPPLGFGGKARCARCNQLLAFRPADPLDRPLALTVAAAIALVIANVMPLMSLSVEGRDATTTLAGGAYEMWIQGSEVTAAIVAFCAVVAPACYVALLLAVLLLVRRPPAPHWTAELMRWVDHLKPWSMNEVLLLGMLVALTKIAQLATVIPGPAMYAVGALVLLLPAITSSLDAREAWRRIAWVTPAGASGAGA
ncbi:MAG: paraquat-inducible protein A [Betaproteobacteria bacterium]